MGYLKDSIYYIEAIQEIEYSFATFYLFETFIVSEVNEGVVITWDNHIKDIVEELTSIYEQNGHGIVYISNRVHSYSVKPSDWLKFYKSNYKLKAYIIVNYNKQGIIASVMEKLFVKNVLKNVNSIEDAIMWAKSLNNKSK